MKNIFLFFEAIYARTLQFFQLLSNPFIVVCATCKKVLHVNKKAKAISHGMCWVCYYKSLGGTFPRLPKLSDFAIYVALFNKQKVEHDEIWSGQTIYKGLRENGRLARVARDHGRSLNSDERHIISNVREVAKQYGYKINYVNDAEMQGWGYFPGGKS